MKTLQIGLAGFNRMTARTMAIARGKHKPAKGEPTAWFTSIERFAKVLSQRNHDLLPLLAQESPESLTELAALAGRSKSTLSRTLKTPGSSIGMTTRIWAAAVEAGWCDSVQASSVSNPATLRVSSLNSTPTKCTGTPKWRYLSA